MTQTIAILGRQPALGVAELESRYGANHLRIIAPSLVLLNKDPAEIRLPQLGGTIKLAKLLTPVGTTDWRKVIAYMAKTLPDHLQSLPEGKIRLGLNTYGFTITVPELNRAGLELKKVIKKAGRSVRVVPNTSLELSSAQTLHNQLAGPTGWEFILIRDGSQTLLAQVVAVQDINAYAARDQKRPKRDAKVGMLPPKLAQIIINLSANHVTALPADADHTTGNRLSRLLDPFCGTGVVLQEALLMGFDAYGTDLEPRMVEYSQTNLEWLMDKYQTTEQRIAGSFQLAVGDATSFQWQQPCDGIAGETYLGRPFATLPKPEVLNEVMNDVDIIHRKFLKNVAAQTQPGFRLCIAVPAWFTRSGVKHLKTLASLEELGYTRISFVHARDTDLIYHRDNQIVGRELVALIRK